MFTGLIEEVGRIVAKDARAEEAVEFTIGTRLLGDASLDGLGLGASLCIDGVCLTVTRRRAQTGEGEVAVVAAFETLKRTTLGQRGIGDRVNLERALRLGDRLGGHLVTGHVDGTGRLLARRQRGEALEIRYDLAPALARLVVEKGSITIDGVSLTVNQVGDDWLEVGLIPHTLAMTQLGDRAVGGQVNLETDVLGKYVARLLERPAGPSSGGVSLELLREHGFLGAEGDGQAGPGRPR